jgi:hypothetical protein
LEDVVYINDIEPIARLGTVDENEHSRERDTSKRQESEQMHRPARPALPQLCSEQRHHELGVATRSRAGTGNLLHPWLVIGE